MFKEKLQHTNLPENPPQLEIPQDMLTQLKLLPQGPNWKPQLNHDGKTPGDKALFVASQAIPGDLQIVWRLVPNQQEVEEQLLLYQQENPLITFTCAHDPKGKILPIQYKDKTNSVPPNQKIDPEKTAAAFLEKAKSPKPDLASFHPVTAYIPTPVTSSKSEVTLFDVTQAIKNQVGKIMEIKPEQIPQSQESLTKILLDPHLRKQYGSALFESIKTNTQLKQVFLQTLESLLKQPDILSDLCLYGIDGDNNYTITRSGTDILQLLTLDDKNDTMLADKVMVNLSLNPDLTNKIRSDAGIFFDIAEKIHALPESFQRFIQICRNDRKFDIKQILLTTIDENKTLSNQQVQTFIHILDQVTYDQLTSILVSLFRGSHDFWQKWNFLAQLQTHSFSQTDESFLSLFPTKLDRFQAKNIIEAVYRQTHTEDNAENGPKLSWII